MRKMSIVLAVALLLPTMALATNITVIGAADCDGWATSVDVVWSQFALSGDLSYSVVLYDDMGIEVTRDELTVSLQYNGIPQDTFSYSGTWDMELCGDYEVVGTIDFVFFAEDGSIYVERTANFTDAFTCICDTPTGCFYTPGYWKNHEENWPVTSLTLGGVTYSQMELLEILNTPVRGDATIILSYHLIAAKLNVLNGAEDTVGDTIMGADDLLSMYPIGTKPGDPGRSEILDHKDILADYNELGCEDDGDLMDSKALGNAKDQEKAVEGAAWGSLKSTFR